MTTRAGLVLTIAVLVAAPARAQTLVPRVLVSINTGLRSPTRTFSDRFTFDVNVEEATGMTEYDVQSGLFVDAGFSVRLVGPIGAGIALSRFSRTETATVTGSIPHPFFFERERTIAGEVSGITRDETVVHAQGVAYLPVGSRVLVVLSAGPSFFSVKQGVVTRITYDESYPFDEATFRSGTLTSVTKRQAGFNAGVDVTIRLTGAVGIGGMLRHTGVELDLPIQDDRTVRIAAGGLQAAGGVRIMF